MPLLREISKNNEKESHKTTGSVQAYTDAKTRDREERDYYSSNSAGKWLLNRFSSKEIDLLKKEFGISSDNRLKAKVESMSDYDLDVLLHRLKNPAKLAYPDYQKPLDTKKPPTTPTAPYTPKPPTTLPEIIKPSQQGPNRITDTGTGGLSAFQAAKNTNHISGVDYNYLISYFKGNEAKAQKAVIDLKDDKLREMINAQKGFSGYAAGQLAGNGSSSLIEKADEAIGNTLISSGNSEMLNKWETFKGNATAAWENTKDIFQDTVEDIGSFVSDKSNTVSKFITENTDQLNVDTDTFKVVKDVYKDYRKQGIDINQYDMENYIDQQGASAFFDRLDNSTMVDGDMYPNGVFLTEREANVAYAQEANNITINDDRETGTVIIKVPVTMEDEKGNKYTVNMYTNDDIYEGMHNNIVTGTIARVAAYTMDPINPVEISISHTHPSDSGNNKTKFSRGFGDEFAARMPGVKNMYVSDVDKGNLLLFDETMPNTMFNKQDNIDYNEDYEITILLDDSLPNIKP